MDHLRELYQEVIIDHNRSPRHCHEMPDANCQAEGFNPLCGDQLKLYLKVQDNKIIDASFTGSGCAISTASASLLTDALIGKTTEQAQQLFTHFHQVMTSEEKLEVDALGKLAVLAGVREFPMRVKCATLAWHTLQAALKAEDKPITTE